MDEDKECHQEKNDHRSDGDTDGNIPVWNIATAMQCMGSNIKP